MKKTLFLFLLLFTPYVSPSQQEDSLSSTYASYENDTLSLEGDVRVYHKLGTLLAEEASLKKEEGLLNSPFSFIHLQKNVHITLKGGAELFCEQADMDFIHSTGALSGKEGTPVIYQTLVRDENNQETLLRIQSAILDFSFLLKEDYAITSSLAKESVFMTYGEDFSLRSDQAFYKDNLFIAYPNQGSSSCTLSYKGDRIESKKIEAHLDTLCLDLTYPEGSISSSLFTNKADPITFSSEALHLDQKKETIVLMRQVQIKEALFGTLLAREQMTIKRENGRILSINTEGEGQITHKEASLVYLGPIHLDGLKGELTTSGFSGKQLVYSDQDITIQADDAFLAYDTDSYTLSSLLLKGNIKLESSEPSQGLRYGLADSLTYSPTTQMIILKADSNNRVLFWDREQNMMISAQEVHICKNQETQKMEIKGIGHIRLLFSPEENTRLKQAFPHLSLAQGSS